jgi:hypothetical protein
LELAFFLSLSRHSSTFFSAAAACLCALLTVVNIVMLTFSGASIADISAQIAKLLCKLAVHRHQCCRCPTNSSTFSVDLSTACHHLDILLFEVRCGTEFTCFSAPHASIYATLPFCILESSCSRRHIFQFMVSYTIYQQPTVIAEQKVHKDYSKCLPVQITKSRKMIVQIPKKLLLLFEI